MISNHDDEKLQKIGGNQKHVSGPKMYLKFKTMIYSQRFITKNYEKS